MTSKQLKILVAGLTVHADIPTYFRDLYGTPDQIQAAITADEDRIRDSGIDVTSFQINDADAAAGLQWIENKLRSEKFDGIVIGSGLRLVPSQTALFESAVQLCVKEMKGAILMFNAGPGTNWDTVQRNMERLERER